eukprot:5482161-Pleurochrysis_carterae.AAC.1
MYSIKTPDRYYQTRGSNVREGSPPQIVRIGASVWPSGPLASRRSVTLAGVAIPDIRMAKLLVARAHAILND